MKKIVLVLLPLCVFLSVSCGNNDKFKTESKKPLLKYGLDNYFLGERFVDNGYKNSKKFKLYGPGYYRTYSGNQFDVRVNDEGVIVGITKTYSTQMDTLVAAFSNQYRMEFKQNGYISATGQIGDILVEITPDQNEGFDYQRGLGTIWVEIFDVPGWKKMQKDRLAKKAEQFKL